MGNPDRKCEAMNDTYEDYLHYLESNLDRIKESMLIDRESPLREMYYRGFMDNFVLKGPTDFSPGLISATDSSEFVR